MALTPEQLEALTALREASNFERTPSRYDEDYDVQTVDYYLASALNSILNWVSIRDYITAPDFEAKKAAAEAERLAKLAKSAEKNRDQIMRGWILNLSNTAYKAFPDRDITIVSDDEKTELSVSAEDPDFTEARITYRKETKSLSTHIDDVIYLSEPATTVHGSTSPYTSFKGFAAVKEHFDKQIKGIDD